MAGAGAGLASTSTFTRTSAGAGLTCAAGARVASVLVVVWVVAPLVDLSTCSDFVSSGLSDVVVSDDAAGTCTGASGASSSCASCSPSNITLVTLLGGSARRETRHTNGIHIIIYERATHGHEYIDKQSLTSAFHGCGFFFLSRTFVSFGTTHGEDFTYCSCTNTASSLGRRVNQFPIQASTVVACPDTVPLVRYWSRLFNHSRQWLLDRWDPFLKRLASKEPKKQGCYCTIHLACCRFGFGFGFAIIRRSTMQCMVVVVAVCAVDAKDQELMTLNFSLILMRRVTLSSARGYIGDWISTTLATVAS